MKTNAARKGYDGRRTAKLAFQTVETARPKAIVLPIKRPLQFSEAVAEFLDEEDYTEL